MTAKVSYAMDFCTLGMFVIDDIEFLPPHPPVKNILGGAGTYAALGARLFSPPPQSREVGWIVDAGSDFPDEIRQTISDWDTSCIVREDAGRLTTRGWNSYGEDEHRAFKFLTPKLRLDHRSLPQSHIAARSFHLICSPQRCIEIVTGIRKARQDESSIDPLLAPLIVWEPTPDLCIYEELDNCRRALKYVDVISPNHAELGSFFGCDTSDVKSDSVNRPLVEECCRHWIERGIGSSRGVGAGAVVVRAGKNGCFIATRRMSKWLPTFHKTDSSIDSSPKVVDPTGAGNTFLGGLAVRLVRREEQSLEEALEEAAIWGSVAASFAIEQIGMPQLTLHSGDEKWNGVRVKDRLHDFKRSLNSYVQP
ncbi:MAG: hypothetical protein M1825_004498 [Sarcosagium campestre]|nr:MAG: hypothetical protein M1825_004498 [Sarcosagium campestre]